MAPPTLRLLGFRKSPECGQRRIAKGKKEVRIAGALAEAADKSGIDSPKRGKKVSYLMPTADIRDREFSVLERIRDN